MAEQTELFTVVAPPVRPMTLREQEAKARPRYMARPSTSAEKCGACLMLRHHGIAQTVRVARWMRRVGACTSTCARRLRREGLGCAHIVLLCNDHAKQQRQVDGAGVKRKGKR